MSEVSREVKALRSVVNVLVDGLRLHASLRHNRARFVDCYWCAWARDAAGVLGDGHVYELINPPTPKDPV